VRVHVCMNVTVCVHMCECACEEKSAEKFLGLLVQNSRFVCKLESVSLSISISKSVSV